SRTVRRAALLALAVACASAGVAAVVQARRPHFFEGNLLRDPGAESVAPEGAPGGWHATGGLTSVSLGSARHDPAFGNRLFVGGRGPAPVSVASQVVDLRRDEATIDRGGVRVVLEAALGGTGAQPDSPDLVALLARRRSDLVPGRASVSLHIGPVTAADRAGSTGLLYRVA